MGLVGYSSPETYQKALNFTQFDVQFKVAKPDFIDCAAKSFLLYISYFQRNAHNYTQAVN